MIKSIIQRIFKLDKTKPLHLYVDNFVFKKILRRNAHIPWYVHFTSTIHSHEKIVAGINVYPGDSPNNYINAYNGIHIGDYTNIGPGVGLISANHDLINNDIHIKASPIKIGKHCWLGMNAIILPEVELGDYTIVGAGAVVTHSFPEGYCVIAGNPAKIIRKLNTDDISSKQAKS